MMAKSLTDVKGGALDASPKKKIRDMIENYAEPLREALPTHLTPDRFLRLLVTAAVSTPDLLECYPPTVLGAAMTCAQLGLEPNTPLGQAYMIPYRNNKAGRMDAQLILGYKGLVGLAYRSGQVRKIVTRAVHDGDHFRYQLGTEEFIEHRPSPSSDQSEATVGPGSITHVYAVMETTAGGVIPEVMPIEAVLKIMRGTQSRGAKGPWRDHFEEMARKTAWRRLSKYALLSPEVSRAVGLDELADAAQPQHLDTWLEVPYEVTTEREAPETQQRPSSTRSSRGEAASASGEPSEAEKREIEARERAEAEAESQR